MLDVLTGFIQELRAVGIPVSMVEAIDAMEALRHTDIGDRAAFKATLGATLVKNARHYEAFDTAFEVYFALHRPPIGDEAEPATEPAADQQTQPMPSDAPGRGRGGGSEADAEAIARALMAALRDADLGRLTALAREAVERLAGMEPGRPVGGTYYLYRTLRRLDTDRLVERLLEELPEDAGELERRLFREELESRLERFKQELEAEIRRRLVADRGREAVAKTLRRPLLEDVDLMHAGRADLAEVEAVIHPLTRKLAARLARRRRLHREGRLDFRKTVRRSLSTGGVPVEPRFRTRKPTKPEVVLLCDISGSMATFARFTMQFVYAMSHEFSKIRSFAFIDAIDEVTPFFEGGVDFETAMARIGTEAEVVWMDGHSDYGHSFTGFWERWGGELTPRTTVIVTGDARNNYRDPAADVLGAIAEGSRGVFWLNPEPRAYWNSGDSVMDAYAPHCTGVYEVRNLRQLEAFVEDISLPPTRRRPAVA